MPPHRYWCLTIYRFASTAVRSAFQVIILPIIVLATVPITQKGYYLALITTISLAIGFPIFLLSAYLGDIYITRYRRRLFIIFGVLLIIGGFVLFNIFHNLPQIILASVLVFSGTCMSESSHSALIPDNVEQEHYHQAVAWLTRFTFLGGLFGPLLAGLLINLLLKNTNENSQQILADTLFFTFLLLTCAIINIFFIDESGKIKPPIDRPDHLMSSNKKRYKYFYVFLFMRLFALVTPIILPSFILYFQRDILHATHPERATAIATTLLTLGGVLSVTWIKPQLIKHYSNLSAIGITLMWMLVAVLSFMLIVFIHHFIWYFAIFVYGMGYGLFFSISFSYALTILPCRQREGFFTSLVSSTTFIAYIIGMILAGPILDNMGYGALEIFFVLPLLISCFFLVFLKKQKESKIFSDTKFFA